MMKSLKAFHILCLPLILVLVTANLSSANGGKVTDESDSGDRVEYNSGISFNFVDVEIRSVIKFISEITGNNFIFDERIKGKITIIAPTKISLEESFSLFTSVLGLKGYTIIPSGPKTFKIIPSSLAKQSGVISVDDKLPVNEAYITKLLPVEHIKASETIQFLRPIVSKNGHISAFGPRNLLLLVDSAINIEKVASILKLIDKPTLGKDVKINVYFLEHADATTLAKVLRGIIKDFQSVYKSLNTGKNGSGKSVSGSVPVLSVTPDKSTNSLVIIASPADYQNITKVIKTLDKKRRQVFVEVMIVEASIDKLKELGTKWRVSASVNNEPIVIGGFGNMGSSALQSVISGLTGLTLGGMGNFMNIPITSVGSDGSVTTSTLTAPGFAALFSLNEFKDSINVLSTPQILTSDNEEAEIIVGENVPFISKRERDVTTTSTVLNSIERKDVGITLRLTPRITEGNFVKLDIYQEISAIKETSESVFVEVGPTTTKRSTRTSVIVKDANTVVIGGLIEEREEENMAKVPILGDIPGLGWLFKSNSTSKSKKNLLVFLSPYIVKESEDLTQLSSQKHKNFVEEQKLYEKGELLVKFNKEISEEQASGIIRLKEATILKYFENINVYNIRLKSEQDINKAIEEFSSLPEVVYAEPNYKVLIQSNPLGKSDND